MIKIENVNFSYSDDKQENHVLESLDIEIGDGEFVCLLGPSGCGKTTLLRMLAGLHFPQSGRVTIDGDEVTGPGDDISIVFQDYALFPWMTAKKNVEFAIKATHKGISRADISDRAMAYLKDVGMADAASKHPYQMSGGMRQRVAIARALSMERKILLMDEPFGALDQKMRTELQNLLETLRYSEANSGKTVVFVTHDISEAVRMADRVIIMDGGRVARDIRVPVRRPRTDLTEREREQLKAIRLELTEFMMENTSAQGRSCRCGGPA